MDYELFKKQIFELSKIDLSSYKEKQMKRRIDSFINNSGFSNYYDYVKALKHNQPLYDGFINHLTINVSEFYRNPEQWTILEKEVLPLLLSKNKTLKIWSAACSTGDEPYTLVMLLAKFMSLKNISIYATDIDKVVLEKAKHGIYNNKSISNLPIDLKNKYFSLLNNHEYMISKEVKACVEFRQHDLLKEIYPLNFDLIICRNVLIYFTEEAKNEIYQKFSNSLKEEGFLFVGSTEQIMSFSNFNLKPFKTFFYRKTTPE